MDNEKLARLHNLSLDQVMSSRFGRYAKYIIQDRALPDARDGLKPVQRRILFSMHELGLFASHAFKKSARVVGDVIGKYHPHGDSSIYEALVRMSQSWKVNIPLVEMHGNNGSIDDDPAAAMRYTEARLAAISRHLIHNLKKETVRFAPNFDDSELEPTVLPALFPNLLVNGARGIAAGYATEMPPHNLGEVVDAIIAKIRRPNIRLDTLAQHIRGPDFPTGAIVQGQGGIAQAFERGRGRILIRSKCEIAVLKIKPSIIITEIPYGVIKAKLVREIDEIRFNNKINGIKDVRDESDRRGLTICIELTPGTNAQAVLNYLLTKTEMQIYYNYNNIAIKDKMPVQMGLIALIDAYLSHQRVVQAKALRFDLARDQRRLQIIEGLIRAATMAAAVIAVIRAAPGSKQGVVAALQATFNFTPLQAGAIAELRLYRLSQTDQTTYQAEKTTLQDAIQEREAILGSETMFNHYLVTLLRDLKKTHAGPRRTRIDPDEEPVSVDMEALIQHEPVWVGISRQGYIKRFSRRTYEANDLTAYAIPGGDALAYLQLISTQHKLLVFTNKGHYIFLPGHKIAETRFKEVGKHINDFATIGQGEQVIGALAVQDFNTSAYITLVTARGKGKRIKIAAFEVARHAKTYKAINLAPADLLVSITISNGLKQLVIITKGGYATKYLETQLPIQGLKAGGIKAIHVEDDEVVASAASSPQEVLGLVSNRGGMKRLRTHALSAMGRTTRGKPIFRTIKGNPHIIFDSGVVTPQTTVLFSKNTITMHRFREVDITSPEEGLSLIGLSNHGVIISNDQIVAPTDPNFQTPNGLAPEEKFQAAAAKVDAASQISIDNLLEEPD